MSRESEITLKDYAKITGASTINGFGFSIIGGSAVLEIAGRNPSLELFLAGLVTAAAGFILTVKTTGDFLNKRKFTQK